MGYLEIIFLAVICFLTGYAKGHLTGFDKGMKAHKDIIMKVKPSRSDIVCGRLLMGVLKNG